MCTVLCFHMCWSAPTWTRSFSFLSLMSSAILRSIGFSMLSDDLQCGSDVFWHFPYQIVHSWYGNCRNDTVFFSKYCIRDTLCQPILPTTGDVNLDHVGIWQVSPPYGHNFPLGNWLLFCGGIFQGYANIMYINCHPPTLACLNQHLPESMTISLL